jgi:hypothetical protein
MLQQGHHQAAVAVLDRVAAAAAAVATGDHAVAAAAAAAADSPAVTGQRQVLLVLPLSQLEAEQLMAAAEQQLSAAGAAVVGLLMPYAALQAAAVEKLLRGQLLVAAEDAWCPVLLVLLLLRGQWVRLVQAAGMGCGADADANADAGTPGAAATTAAVVGRQVYQFYRLLLGLAGNDTSSSSTCSRQKGQQQQQQHGNGLVLACLLPHAVSQLCLEAVYSSAAAMVAGRMRFCGSLSTLQGCLLVLERYLSVVMHSSQQASNWLSGQADLGSSTSTSRESVVLLCCERWLSSMTMAAAYAAHTRLIQAMTGPSDQQGMSQGA